MKNFKKNWKHCGFLKVEKSYSFFRQQLPAKEQEELSQLSQNNVDASSSSNTEMDEFDALLNDLSDGRSNNE